MKKFALVWILFLVSLSLVLAEPQIIFQHNDLQPGETLFAEIVTSGEFVKEIVDSDIEIYQGNRKIQFNYDIIFYEGKHYFYIQDLKQGNFTIKISNILYKSPGLREVSLEKGMVVRYDSENESHRKIISISPGFVFASTLGKIMIKNKGNINLNVTVGDDEFLLIPEDYEKVQLVGNDSFFYFNVSSYRNFKIPVVCLLQADSENESVYEESLRVGEKYLYININENEEKNVSFEIFNFGDTNVTGIEISDNIEIIEVEGISEIGGKCSAVLNISVLSKLKGYEEGNITVKYFDEGNRNITVPVYIYIFSENTTEEEQVVSEESCEDIGAVKCSSYGEICEGEETYSEEGVCCFGECRERDFSEDEDEEENNNWWVGLLIFLFIGGVGFFIFIKVKKTKRKKPVETLKEKTKIYEKRVGGRISKG